MWIAKRVGSSGNCDFFFVLSEFWGGLSVAMRGPVTPTLRGNKEIGWDLNQQRIYLYIVGGKRVVAQIWGVFRNTYLKKLVTS
jgi:hypothetical protein